MLIDLSGFKGFKKEYRVYKTYSKKNFYKASEQITVYRQNFITFCSSDTRENISFGIKTWQRTGEKGNILPATENTTTTFK